MSDIPKARALLKEALALLDREKPTFVSRKRFPRLSDNARAEARILRNEGMSMNEIAKFLDTNIGRVSEAINEFR